MARSTNIRRPVADEQSVEMEEEQPGVFRSAHEAGMRSAGGAVTGALRGMSTAMMASAFEKFGKAFTDTGYRGSRHGGGAQGPQAGLDPVSMGPFRQAGQRAGQALEHRWQLMELEEFNDSHIEGWKNNVKSLTNEFTGRNRMLDDGFWENPNGEPEPLDTTSEVGRERLRRYRGELYTKFSSSLSDIMMDLGSEAAKYPNNTMIGATVAQAIKFQSDKLMKAVNPQAAIQSEKGFSDIMVQERESKTNQMNARTAAKAAKEPNSIRQALDDTRIGVQDILPWMTSGPGAELLHSSAGEPFRNSAQERYRQYLIDEEGFMDDGPGGEETQKLDNKMKSSERTILNIAAVDYLKSVDPKAAEAAKIYQPQYFAHEVTGEDKPKGVRKGLRLSKKQTQMNIKGWETEIDKKLTSYMSDPTNPSDIGSALDFILGEWLPKAMVGETEDQIPAGILATRSDATSGYRDDIKFAMEAYLKKNWGRISAIAKETNLELFKRQRNRRASETLRRARGRGPRRGLTG